MTCVAPQDAESAAPLPAPACPKVEHEDTRHGITRRDEYHWLRALNWREVFRDCIMRSPKLL